MSHKSRFLQSGRLARMLFGTLRNDEQQDHDNGHNYQGCERPTQGKATIAMFRFLLPV
jgi:hypothetical protein